MHAGNRPRLAFCALTPAGEERDQRRGRQRRQLNPARLSSSPGAAAVAVAAAEVVGGGENTPLTPLGRVERGQLGGGEGGHRRA